MRHRVITRHTRRARNCLVMRTTHGRHRYTTLGRLVTGSGAAVAVRATRRLRRSAWRECAHAQSPTTTHPHSLAQVKKLLVDQFIFAPMFLALIVSTCGSARSTRCGRQAHMRGARAAR